MKELVYTTALHIEKEICRLHKLHQTILEEELLSIVEQMPLPCLARVAEEVLSNLIAYASFHRFDNPACARHNEINGLINQKWLKKPAYYYRVKHSRRPIGHTYLESVLGAMKNHYRQMAVLITNAKASSRIEICNRTIPEELAFIDGVRLVEYMIEYNIGVLDDGPYKIKRIDHDYFRQSKFHNLP